MAWRLVTRIRYFRRLSLGLRRARTRGLRTRPRTNLIKDVIRGERYRLLILLLRVFFRLVLLGGSNTDLPEWPYARGRGFAGRPIANVVRFPTAADLFTVAHAARELVPNGYAKPIVVIRDEKGNSGIRA